MNSEYLFHAVILLVILFVRLIFNFVILLVLLANEILCNLNPLSLPVMRSEVFEFEGRVKN